MKINTKQQMYRLLSAGRFGNYPRLWNSPEEIGEYRGLISIRSREINNPIRLYHVPACELKTVLALLPEEQTRGGLTFTETPPDLTRTIQGEYDGRHLTYTFARYPMRIAFDEQCLHAEGLAAKWLLKGHMQPQDYEWLLSLLDEFPGSIVEFSAYSVLVGQVKGSQCIFWEVRHY